MPCLLRGHLLVKKPFAIFLNGTSTGTDHSRKRDLFQIIRHKRPASSCTQPCLMAILHQFCNRLYSTGRCPLFNITDRTISIKKHCFFVNLLSTSCRRSTFITSLENVIRHKIPPQALQSRRYLSHRQSHKENAWQAAEVRYLLYSLQPVYWKYCPVSSHRQYQTGLQTSDMEHPPLHKAL